MNTNGKYILNGREVHEEPDLMKWAEWFETADRFIKETEKDGVRISTAFLGIDHQYLDGEPLLFETMVFGGEYDLEMDRYSNIDAAEKGHDEMVRKVFGA